MLLVRNFITLVYSPAWWECFLKLRSLFCLFPAGIRKLFVDQSGTKLVFLDDKSDGYIYCPVISDIAALICMLAYK